MTLPVTLPFTLGEEIIVDDGLTTVIVVNQNPALYPNWLGGSLLRDNTVVNLSYSWSQGVGDGAVNAIDAALHEYPGKKIVTGHSGWAALTYKWLRDKGPTSDIDPADVTFITTGCPERKYNGLTIVAPEILPPWYGAFGFPIDTPYRVIDIARQYDGVADYPNVKTNSTAVSNAWSGFLIQHLDYFDVSLNDPNNLRYDEGNASYILAPSFPIPYGNEIPAAVNLVINAATTEFEGPTSNTWENTPDAQREQDRLLRPTIESAYSRPMFVPMPDYYMGVQVDFKDDAILRAKLNSDSRTAISTAEMMAAIEQAAPTEVIVTLYDKVYTPRGECGDYLSVQAAFPRHLVETGQLVMKGEDPLAPAALLCHEEVVPITIEVGKLLWHGRIKVAKDRWGVANQADTVECELEGDRAWLMKILAWPNYLLPIQVQFPPRGVAIGTAISIIKWLVTTQTYRLQAGLNDLINNLGSLNLDWRSWFGTFLMQDTLGPDGVFDLSDIMRVVRTPIYVPQGTFDWFFDTSPLISINWRMDKLYELIDQVVKDNGLVVEVGLWRPGDPQPKGTDPAFPLTVPTIVVDVKDRMGIVGPTHTFLDGILRTLIDLQESVFGEITTPFLNPNGLPVPEGFNIAPVFGLNFVQPWVLFMADHPQSGCWGELDHHHPLAWRTVIGGKSPKWMNDLMNAFWSWILDSVMIIIGFTGVPSNLFDGLFNDILLAFALADNMTRRIKLGPYGYPEWFAPMGSPYNIDGLLAMRREQWNTRGYISGKVNFDNGYPYEVGRDLFVGSLASIIRRGKVYTDFVEQITITDNRREMKVEVQIGDGQAEEPTVVKTYRNFVKFQETLNILTMSTGT